MPDNNAKPPIPTNQTADPYNQPGFVYNPYNPPYNPTTYPVNQPYNPAAYPVGQPYNPTVYTINQPYNPNIQPGINQGPYPFPLPQQPMGPVDTPPTYTEATNEKNSDQVKN